MQLKNNEARILGAIMHLQRNGPVTYRRIAAHLGWSSFNSVTVPLKKLLDLNLVEYAPALTNDYCETITNKSGRARIGHGSLRAKVKFVLIDNRSIPEQQEHLHGRSFSAGYHNSGT